jgi:dipeptidyl aminopeptidase/acylaminoacyl peptidase
MNRLPAQLTLAAVAGVVYVRRGRTVKRLETFESIPAGRDSLAACLNRPESTSGPGPVVICCHGLTGTRVGSCYRFVTLARRLEAAGIACLRFDFRGSGESTGDFSQVTAASLLEDLEAAIAFLQSVSGIDLTRIGMVGSSFGCFTASHLAARLPGLRCLVFWAPVADPRELAGRDMNEAAWALLRRQGWVDHHGLRLGAVFFETLPVRSGPDALAESPCPLLIYHGKADRQVPIDQGLAYAEVMKRTGVDAVMHAIDSSDHGMRSVSNNDLILDGTLAWLQKYLQADAASRA